MEQSIRRAMTSGLLAGSLLIVGGLGAIAQDEPQAATVAEVVAASVAGAVSIDGAILGQRDVETYLFSDGTEVVVVSIEPTESGDAIPILTLLNIMGLATEQGIDVTAWATLDIMVPAVVRTPPEAIDAFQGWIITQGSLAPVEVMESDSDG